MPKSEISTSRKRVYVDYKPAELRINTDWLIVYYAKIPAQNEFKRFRVRVPVISPKSERFKYGKKWLFLSIRSWKVAGRLFMKTATTDTNLLITALNYI